MVNGVTSAKGSGHLTAQPDAASGSGRTADEWPTGDGAAGDDAAGDWPTGDSAAGDWRPGERALARYNPGPGRGCLGAGAARVGRGLTGLMGRCR